MALTIGKAFVELRVDDKQFKSGLLGVRSSMQDTQKGLQNLSNAAAAALLAGTAAVAGLVKLQVTQEKAELDLAAALRRTNDLNDERLAQLKQFARDTQAVTTFGDEQILQGIAFAKNLGVQADQLEDATTAALGLAAAFRIDLNTAFNLIGRAAGGNT